MQFASSERRLQHIAGIHRPLCFTGTHHRVQFVDEQNDVTFLLGEFVEHGLQTLFEFPAKLGSCNQCTHIERKNAFVFETLWDFTVQNALSEPLDDCGLADPRLAYENRVVFSTALQHLHGAPNLVVAADDRVQLALFRPLREIDRVLVQCLAMLLGIGVVHRLAGARRLNRLVEQRRIDARFGQRAAHQGVGYERAQYHFARQILIAALLRITVRQREHARERLRGLYIPGWVGQRRQLVQRKC